MYSQMVCLVGENPLPIYLGIKQLGKLDAPDASIVLVHSDETKQQAQRLEETCRVRLNFRNIRLELIKDPFKPTLVMQRMQQLRNIYPGFALNYTGGTKVMSGFSLMNWTVAVKEQSLLDRAFYLEERSGTFHFGDRAEGIPLKIPLTLDELRELHGVGEPSPEGGIRLTPQDLHNIMGNQPSRTMFPKGPPKNYQIEEMRKQETSDWCKFLDMLTPETRRTWEQNAIGRFLRAQARCAAGIWFEQYVERLIRLMRLDGGDLSFDAQLNDGTPLFSRRDIFANQHFPVLEQAYGFNLEFETDLLVVYGHRLRYLSVTTSRNPETCKAKLFQAKYRAQQIGGGMASSCVVCLGQEGIEDKNGRTCSFATALRLGLGDDARHQIFDRTDVEQWHNGDLTSLRRFLTE